MTKRIFRPIFPVALAVLLVCPVLTMSSLYGYFTHAQHAQLTHHTHVPPPALAALPDAYHSPVPPAA